MTATIQNIVVVYGSVSGNAKGLARQLYSDHELTQHFEMSLCTLDEIQYQHLDGSTFVACISSSFGDGEPPGNGEAFWQSLQENPHNLQFDFGVFGLGDTAYPHFCGFTKGVDELWSQQGARRRINLVDADLNYQPLFEQWLSALKQGLLQNSWSAAETLDISISAYDEAQPFPAVLMEKTQLTETFPCLYRYTLSIQASGIQYLPGDIVHLMLNNNERLLNTFVDEFQIPPQQAFAWYSQREIARISKPTLRKIVGMFPNPDIKELLKNKNKNKLTDYLSRHQVIDVVRDFYPPNSIDANRLAECLPQLEPRTYSIASSQAYADEKLEICVREVWSQPSDSEAIAGCATAYLADATLGDTVPLFVRNNSHFHFNDAHSAILIATGAGIAPFIGFLQSRLQAVKQNIQVQPVVLIFGEKYRNKDYAYHEFIQTCLDLNVLDHCLTAFSRDGLDKCYVQDVVENHSDLLASYIDEGAHVYVCGRKQNLSAQVEPMVSSLDIAEHTSLYQQLTEQERVHLDLF